MSDLNYFSDDSRWLEAFKQGLRDLGYTDRQNIILVQRNAQSDHSLLDKFAAELVSLKVDVIVASSTTAATAAKNATTIIPIVAWGAGPISTGLVQSLERPGGNLTGFTLAPDTHKKYLLLLKEIVPGLTHVAILYNRSYSIVPDMIEETQSAARSLNLQLQLVEIREPQDLDQGFSAMVREHAGAILVLNHAIFFQARARVAELAIKNRLPMMAPYRAITEAGSLMGHEPGFQHVWRRAATFVDKILKGTKASDLPLDQSTKMRIFINLKTAEALGITIPQAVLRQADEVVQ